MKNILRIFLNPSGAFKSLKENPKVMTAFWLLVVVMVCYMAVFRAQAPFEQRMTAVFELQEANGVEIPDDFKNEMLEKGESVYVVILSYLALPVTIAVLFFFLALFIQFFGYFFTGGRITIKESYLVTIYGSFPPTVVMMVVVMIIMMVAPENIDYIRPERTFAANLSVLVDRGANKLLADFLATFDLFQIWRAVLITIGVSTMIKVKDEKKTKLSLAFGISVFLFFGLLQFLVAQLVG